MIDIAYQNKDIASKCTSETLIGRSLAPFGLPDLRIVDILPTNLPAIESNELRLDNLFLLSDGSLAIIDYESKFTRENFVKYINYIARVLKRYSLNKKLNEIHEIRMIVIYTADVEYAEETYTIGGLTLNIESAYLVNLNSNHIYQKLRCKIENHEPLTEEELTELMILPLTAKGTSAKQNYIQKAVQLAKQLPNRSTTLSVLSGLLTFTDKIIDKTYAQQIKEEFFMLTQVEQLIYEDAIKYYNEYFTKYYSEKMENAIKENTAIVTADVTAKLTQNAITALIKVCQNFHATKEYALQQLLANFPISEETALQHIQEVWE